MAENRALSLGLPRMHEEAGEKRDFLPDFAEALAGLGLEIFIERGIGSGMGQSDADYTARSPKIHVTDHAEAFRQDLVLVLRFPELEALELVKPGATLISMIHFPTRPRRIRRLRAAGLEAVSLDSLADDGGRRLVENMRAVGWNGLEAAFDALEKTYPQFLDSNRPPIRVTVLGAGAVGKHAMEASTKYGRLERARALDGRGLPGVEVTVIGRNLTEDWRYMRERLLVTDLLVDATSRSDPTTPIIPNAWVGWLPRHAVICDLAVDPYVLEVEPPTVRGVEGIPRGTLDQILFLPDDPKWDSTVPSAILSAHRRATVSCYSWPGVHPEACMALYGRQLFPLLETFVRKGGMDGIRRDGDDKERALWRASLRAWAGTLPEDSPSGSEAQD